MPVREDCEWRHNPISEPICHWCLGWIVLNNGRHCPFHGMGDPKPEFQHLITAGERFYSIQLRAKLIKKESDNNARTNVL